MSSTPSTPRPYLDEQGRTDAEVYLTDIYDGKIVACKYMKQFADIMLPRISDGYKEWHFDVDKALRPVKFIEKFCRIPASKNAGMPFILYPYERMPIELAFGFVGDDGYRQIRQVIIEWARKNGKALALDTEIPTPDGWHLMRDIHPGDYVFGQDGKPSKVLVESETFDKPMYLVTFDDGSALKATDDHIWTVMNIDAGEWVDMTTEELAPHVNALDASGRQVEEWMVPLCKPIEYECRFFPENPYEVGSRCALSGTPIPDEYLLGSVAQRRAMYDGVVDAIGDNTFGEHFMEFGTESSVFIKTLKELVASLGLKDISSPDALVCSVGPNGKLISSIERIPNEPSKCIAIDNESHLYLAGRGYTTTHNTSLLAALNLYMLTSDGGYGNECYNGSCSESQARLCYGATDAMRRMSPHLSKRVHRGMVQKRGVSGLNYPKTDSFLCTVSSATGRLDGLSASWAVLDEIGASTDNNSLLSILEESTSARPQPLIWCITTENYVRSSTWDERKEYSHKWLAGVVEDDRFLPMLYTLDSKDEIYNEKAWVKANPGLEYGVKDIEYLRDRVNLAKQSPSRMPSLLTKEFNLVSGEYSSFLNIEDCVNKEPIDFEEIGIPPYVCVGFDLAAGGGDLCGCVCRWKMPGDDRFYEIAKAWIPSEKVNLNTDANQKDNVPYLQWSSQGQEFQGTTWHYVEIVEGDRINQMVVLDFLRDLVSVGMYPFCIAYDPWRVDDWTDRETRRLVGDSRVYPVPQTARVISPLMKVHKLDLHAKRVICPNPCLHQNRANVQARTDHNDNVFPQKKNLNSKNRIDLYMCELYSLAAYQKFEEEYLSAIGWAE